MLDASPFTRRCERLLAALLLSLACCAAGAEERLARLFTDHMVMQRGIPVPVWGWVEPGETVTVTIDAQTKTAKANDAGKWLVRLDPMQPGPPRKMTVKGQSRADAIELTDILVGEVWLASGQSNMRWPLRAARGGANDIAASANPQIRLFNVPGAGSPKGPADRLPLGNPRVPNMNAWLPASPATTAEFSAVAYYFARDLQKSLNVPVGVIANAVDGSAIEAWISRDSLLADPNFKFVAEYFDGLANFIDNTTAGKEQLAERAAQYEARQVALRASGQQPMWPPKYSSPLQSASFGSTFFNALIHPMLPFAIRGVIWYQGEAQWERMFEFRGIFPLLIKDWRGRWGQGDFPFIYVQLPNFQRASQAPEWGGWAYLREAQLLALKVPNTAMAVTIELGESNNIHPSNKLDVGQRLALAARGLAYGEKLTFSGPIYRSMKVEGSAIRLSFDHVGRGLMVGKKAAGEPTVEDAGEPLKRFAIAGEDMKFTWGDARIDGNTVVVSSPAVPKPVAVRYAWADNPEGCNLYNKDGLPASPFRTDESKPQVMGEYFRNLLNKGFVLPPAF